MRDINRIDETVEALREYWKKYPDYRLGQLIYNVNQSRNKDVFFPEDDQWLKWLKEGAK